MIIQSAYSFYLGSDKNKKNSSSAIAKSNVRETISKNNNEIQNSADLLSVITIITENRMTESMILKLL